MVIRIGATGRPEPETDATGRLFHFALGEAYLYWKQLGAFLVRGGREITVEPATGVEARTIRLPLLGMVLGVLLHQQGLLALHASAVAIDGEVVAFIGDKGDGKSTTAAALYARGHQLVGDDVVALAVGEEGDVTALPSFPHFKLWPDAAAAALGDDPEALPRLEFGYEKRGRPAFDRFAQRPLPLRRLYRLGRGPSPAIERLSPQEAVLHLVRESFPIRVFKESLPASEAAANMLRCARLARNVPVHWLRRHVSLEALPEIARLVEADLWAAR